MIPVPNDLKNPQFKSQNGTFKYIPDKDSIVWILKDLPGQSELRLSIQFNVPTIRNGINLLNF
jgi:AP-1 complex subunit mu